MRHCRTFIKGVVSKNTNELQTGVPGRFGLEVVHHQYPSAPEIKDLRTVHASANERISRLRSRS